MRLFPCSNVGCSVMEAIIVLYLLHVSTIAQIQNGTSGCVFPGRGDACSEGESSCIDGERRIGNHKVCDGRENCSDGSDEVNCTTSCRYTGKLKSCGQDRFCCGDNMHCVSNFFVCDGRKDCEDGSDELRCDFTCVYSDVIDTCGSDNMCCGDKRRCVSKNTLCDGLEDCNDGSDEVNCANTCDYTGQLDSCTYERFCCKEQSQCILNAQVCDGFTQCNDKSDELNCTVSTTTLSMTRETTLTLTLSSVIEDENLVTIKQSSMAGTEWRYFYFMIVAPVILVIIFVGYYFYNFRKSSTIARWTSDGCDDVVEMRSTTAAGEPISDKSCHQYVEVIDGYETSRPNEAQSSGANDHDAHENIQSSLINMSSDNYPGVPHIYDSTEDRDRKTYQKLRTFERNPPSDPYDNLNKLNAVTNDKCTEKEQGYENMALRTSCREALNASNVQNSKSHPKIVNESVNETHAYAKLQSTEREPPCQPYAVLNNSDAIIADKSLSKEQEYEKINTSNREPSGEPYAVLEQSDATLAETSLTKNQEYEQLNAGEREPSRDPYAVLKDT